VPRVSTEERSRRDALIWQLFLAGVSYRQIGKNPRVQLSCRGVELAVRRQISGTAERRNLLTDEAMAVHTERLERLFATAYGDAVRGNLRAGEQCRRLLDQMARVHGLYAGAAERSAPEDANDSDDVGEDGMDDLQRYRLRCGQQLSSR
jgi:hypothetical protein